MSYDLAVFFASDEFPVEPWLSLLDEMGDTADRDPADYEPRSAQCEWRTIVDDSSVFTTLFTLKDPENYNVAESFRWRLGVYTNSGCTPTAHWTQFAIPYRCLAFIDCTIAYDPQSGNLFDSPDQYWVFASNAISRWPGLPRKLRRLGLLNEDGMLALDRPPTAHPPQRSLRDSR